MDHISKSNRSGGSLLRCSLLRGFFPGFGHLACGSLEICVGWRLAGDLVISFILFAFRNLILEIPVPIARVFHGAVPFGHVLV